MPLTIYQVDSFTDRPFAGNPAGVCILSEPKTELWMQSVAKEMNVAETAFLVPQGDDFSLRWFTPAVEVDLCGHATLASAHILWESGALTHGAEARFHTKSGLLTANQADGWIVLNFPSTPPEPADMPPLVGEAIGVPAVYCGKSPFDYLIEVESEAIVRELNPDLRKIATASARGVIVTARSSSADQDFVSRFFAPQAGVDEDPVTGSAHCALGPYWRSKLGKDSMLAYQASPRGGFVRVTVQGDRVLLGGKAVTVLKAELLA